MKNIVVFSDGTGQEGGKGFNTNVYKLFNMIEDRTDRQIAFYDAGLGTDWHLISGNVGGFGITKNILQCYRFIFDNYEAGDSIFLFGFSRGATTVRSLSGFIDQFGLLPKSRTDLIKKAYAIYKIEDQETRKRKIGEFLGKHRTMWVRIKFLGVWDTVAALGIPFKSADGLIDRLPGFRHKFHNLTLSPAVENAYHALSIDDERLTFHPTLWDPQILPYQKMKQVWFCGVHTDVGGGYREQGLSDIALLWLKSRALEQGLRIYSENKTPVPIDPDPNGFMHDSRGTALTALYRRKVRTWDFATRGKPVVHQSVLDRKLSRDNKPDPHYAPWILDPEQPWMKAGGCSVEPWNTQEGLPSRR